MMSLAPPEQALMANKDGRKGLHRDLWATVFADDEQETHHQHPKTGQLTLALQHTRTGLCLHTR